MRRLLPRRLLTRRLGLRDRVALGFGLMALVLATVLAVTTWLFASAYLMAQQEEAALAQATDHALTIRTGLRAGQDVATLVDRLHYSQGGAALLIHDGRRFRGTTSTDATFPEELVRRTGAGGSAPVHEESHDGTYLAVGVPMADGDVFLELFPRADLVRTLRALWLSLLVSAAITTLIGVVAGRVVARRLLRPVEEVTAAAAAVAQGDLDARLDPGADPDLAELAASFNQTARSLQHRVLADARFAGDVSHELRTPLTTMVNAMESLKNRRRVLPATALEPLDLLDHELERFRQLVIDLLEISRADSGDEEVREPVRVAELVRRAADAAAGRPVTSVAPAAEHLEVAADRRRLAQVVANLVTNAELHGGGCTRVCVEATGRDVLVTVDDAGPGVPMDSRQRIFERFARGPGREEGGFGLGLAIVARHVAWHRGTIAVVDGPDGGARFVLRLPASTGGVAPRKAPATNVGA